MANCRYISTSFWTDTKVVDDFTPEDRYVYLYCMTNPHTTVSGCYEISIKQIASETGYSMDAVTKILQRLDETHKVLRYSSATKELILLKWYRYNWTSSPKINQSLLESIRRVKNTGFREYLAACYNARDSITAPYEDALPDGAEPPDSAKITEEGDDTSPEPPKPPKKPRKPKSTNKQEIIQSVFEDFAGENKDLLDTLENFQKMRDAIKKPLTEAAKKLLVKKLVSLGKTPEEQIAILNQSIFNNWQGVFALKDNGNGGTENGAAPEHTGSTRSKWNVQSDL